MKLLGKTLDIICKVMTKYFLIWCPKDTVVELLKSNNTDDEFDEYKTYYTKTTRWI